MRKEVYIQKTAGVPKISYEGGPLPVHLKELVASPNVSTEIIRLIEDPTKGKKNKRLLEAAIKAKITQNPSEFQAASKLAGSDAGSRKVFNWVLSGFKGTVNETPTDTQQMFKSRLSQEFTGELASKENLETTFSSKTDFELFLLSELANKLPPESGILILFASTYMRDVGKHGWRVLQSVNHVLSKVEGDKEEVEAVASKIIDPIHNLSGEELRKSFERDPEGAQGKVSRFMDLRRQLHIDAEKGMKDGSWVQANGTLSIDDNIRLYELKLRLASIINSLPKVERNTFSSDAMGLYPAFDLGYVEKKLGDAEAFVKSDLPKTANNLELFIQEGAKKAAKKMGWVEKARKELTPKNFAAKLRKGVLALTPKAAMDPVFEKTLGDVKKAVGERLDALGMTVVSDMQVLRDTPLEKPRGYYLGEGGKACVVASEVKSYKEFLATQLHELMHGYELPPEYSRMLSEGAIEYFELAYRLGSGKKLDPKKQPYSVPTFLVYGTQKAAEQLHGGPEHLVVDYLRWTFLEEVGLMGRINDLFPRSPETPDTICSKSSKPVNILFPEGDRMKPRHQLRVMTFLLDSIHAQGGNVTEIASQAKDSGIVVPLEVKLFAKNPKAFRKFTEGRIEMTWFYDAAIKLRGKADDYLKFQWDRAIGPLREGARGLEHPSAYTELASAIREHPDYESSKELILESFQALLRALELDPNDMRAHRMMADYSPKVYMPVKLNALDEPDRKRILEAANVSYRKLYSRTHKK